MIAIGRYLIFVISLAGMTLFADGRFSEEIIAQYLDHMFELHNNVRGIHGVKRLKRTVQMDANASERIDKLLSDKYEYTDLLGINYSMQYYNYDTKLDAAEAEQLFSEWYNTNDKYNYFFEPLHNINDNFTQIVWKNTKNIGLAFRSVDEYYLVLVLYDPRGNIEGQFTSNVMIPPSIAAARNPETNMLIYQGDENRFLAYILELHNTARSKHGVRPLQRNEDMDSKASELCKIHYELKYTENYGINTILRYFHVDFKMNAKEAESIFSEWYDKGANNDGSIAISNKYAASFKHIVWKDTTDIGLAIERFTDSYRVVVLYSPPRRIPKRYKRNVPRLQLMEQGESSANLSKK